MLRFVHLVLTNPARPELEEMKVRAMVLDADIGLLIGGGLVKRLQLEHIMLRDVEVIGEESRVMLPYLGPLRITHGHKEMFSGALTFGPSMVAMIGKSVVQELGINPEPTPLTPWWRGINPDHPEAIALMKEKSSEKILILEDAVDPETCKTIFDYAVEEGKRSGSVLVGTNQSKVDKNVRDVSIVNDIAGIRQLIDNTMYKLFAQHVEPFFGVEIDSWEIPQILNYEPGGKYEAHVDGERMVSRPGGIAQWERIMDRDISLLLYVNDDFTGGALNFPRQQVKIQPKTGMVVAFPSTGHYRHGAEATESGLRVAVVTWANIKGTPRLHDTGDHWVQMKTLRRKGKT